MHARRKPTIVPDIIWAPLVSGGLMLIVGLLGLWAHQPWIFPSLGPTAFLQAEQPNLPVSTFHNTVIGHFIGLGAGLLSVFVLGATTAPGVLCTGELVPVRVGAAVLAVIAMFIKVRTKLPQLDQLFLGKVRCCQPFF